MIYLGLHVEPEDHSLCQKINDCERCLSSSNIAPSCDLVQTGKDVHKASRVHQRSCLPFQLSVVTLSLHRDSHMIAVNMRRLVARFMGKLVKGHLLCGMCTVRELRTATCLHEALHFLHVRHPVQLCVCMMETEHLMHGDRITSVLAT